MSAGASGTAALILELVWGRELALVLGGARPAVAAVLAAFMLGMGLGNLLGGSLADRVRRPAVAVGAIEVAIAVIGPLLSVMLINLPGAIDALLPSSVDATAPGFLLLRLLVVMVLLLPATVALGATFPLLARAAGSSVGLLHHAVGRLYAAGTFGGVCGVLLCGFLLLPRAGIPGAIAVAAVGSLIAAGCAVVAARALPVTRREGASPPPSPVPVLTVLAAAASGALVLAGETVWHRALLVVLPGSSATLSLLLALTLAGLAAGGFLVSPLLRRPFPMRWWGAVQAAVGAVLALQAVAIPHIADLVVAIRPDAGWGRVLAGPLAVGGALILPATVLMGAAWPLLLAVATPRVDDGGRRIGRMGVANSIGAAGGALAGSFLLLSALGFGPSLLALAGLHLVLAATATDRPRRRWITAVAAAIVLTAAVAVPPRTLRVPLPSLALERNQREVLLYDEATGGTVIVTEDPVTGTRSLYVDSIAAIGSTYDALKLVRMLGILPVLLHPEPRTALVIGLGAGVTAAVVASTPGLDATEVAEIVPGVVAAAPLFRHLNHGVVDRPDVRVIVNDGRNHLALTDRRYDLITCDPVHPLYGSASLYSREFFELCRRRLTPGGVVCQYLPLHRMPTEAFRRAVATFRTVFPEAWVFFGVGHAVLAGGDGPLDLDWNRWRRVLDNHPLATELAASALATPGQIAAIAHLPPAAVGLVADGAPSTDLYPRLEFLAPEAYRPGLWEANAKLLIEAYRSPLGLIRNLPPEAVDDVRRLVAGKRLLLFSRLERQRGDLRAAGAFLATALEISPRDPELQGYAAEMRELTSR